MTRCRVCVSLCKTLRKAFMCPIVLRSISLPVLTFLLLLNGCSKNDSELVEKQVVRPVKMIRVEAANTTETIRFPAIIDAGRMSDLSLQVSGLIKELPFKESQEIKKGQVLAKLDQRDFINNLASSKAQFKNADAEYQRAVKLSEQDAIARNVLEQRKSQVDIAKAQLDTAEKALADTVLHAPFSGLIAKLPVKRLQAIRAGDIVAKVMDTNTLTSKINLPASIVAQIPKDEDPEKNGHTAYIALDAAPDQLIKAKFKEASLIADAASQTYAITFAFNPPDNLTILPGMNATMELRANTETTSPRVAVPLDAVLNDGTTQYVWLLDSNTMQVTKRAVVIEEGVGQTVVVTDGVAINDIIIGAGAAYLSEGMKVREWTR